jgi:hypothetical protein
MVSRSKSSRETADFHRKAFREAVAKAEARNTRAAVVIGRHAIDISIARITVMLESI